MEQRDLGRAAMQRAVGGRTAAAEARSVGTGECRQVRIALATAVVLLEPLKNPAMKPRAAPSGRDPPPPTTACFSCQMMRPSAS